MQIGAAAFIAGRVLKVPSVESEAVVDGSASGVAMGVVGSFGPGT